MNISGILLTFDDLAGENIGTIRAVIIIFQFFLFRVVSVNWNFCVRNVVLRDSYILVELWLLKTAHTDVIR